MFVYGGENSTTGAVPLARQFFTALPLSLYGGFMTTNDAHVYDSPEGWVSDHIQRYVETGGQEGHVWNGVPTLLLTTKGRKSGKLRRTALIYGKSGSSYVVVASKGGDPNHPAWYLNLTENPEVAVQVGAGRFRRDRPDGRRVGEAGAVGADVRIWPAYEEYQTKTDRPIPVVVLDPVPAGVLTARLRTRAART